MNKIVHYIGLDVHKDSIAVAIAPQNSSEVRRYGIIGGTLDAVDKLLKGLSQPNIEHCCSGTARQGRWAWNMGVLAPLPGAAGLSGLWRMR